MPAMTYTSLFIQVQSYLNRNDAATSEQIPNFIYQAQQELSLACKTILVESYVVGTFTKGETVYPKPANWRRNISMNVGSNPGGAESGDFNIRNPMLLRPYEFIRNYTPDTTDQSQRGIPKFYADYGYANFLITPVPYTDFPFEYCFLQIPEPISETNQTNYWTNFAPQVLLYATMLEAMYYVKNDERIPVFESRLQKGIQLINQQDEMRMVDRSAARQSD